MMWLRAPQSVWLGSPQGLIFFFKRQLSSSRSGRRRHKTLLLLNNFFTPSWFSFSFPNIYLEPPRIGIHGKTDHTMPHQRGRTSAMPGLLLQALRAPVRHAVLVVPTI